MESAEDNNKLRSENNHGLYVGINQGSVQTTFHQHHDQSDEQIDYMCFRALKCPDSLRVKNDLKAKDKLLREAFDWILNDPKYISWRDGKEKCLLWIKGEAGKGKTMMSIGLIELLSQRSDDTIVIYSFFQNANNQLNTVESLLKGLIYRLAHQKKELKASLRSRWDREKERFIEDVESWRVLWNILLEMLDRCTSKVFIVVDALDECQGTGKGDFLKLLIRNGLDHGAKIKWLLTSRPLEVAERTLLAVHEQMQVSLELNPEHISQSIHAYIEFKVRELGLEHRYEETLIQQLKTDLNKRAEGTFLWVSLVCQRLETTHQNNVLATLQELPPGLSDLYHLSLRQLSADPSEYTRLCLRLLKTMMLAFRPLRLEEFSSVTGISIPEDTLEKLVKLCTSFVRIQERSIEFIHQSARDYLAGDHGWAILDSSVELSHYHVVSSCIACLSGRLKVNLIGLPRPDSGSDSWRSTAEKDKANIKLLNSLDYAATYWVQHLLEIEPTETTHYGLIDHGLVGEFLHGKMLEWLEYLSLQGALPKAFELFQTLLSITKNEPLTLAFIQDAVRFLSRHYHRVSRFPLQIYSYALIFTPEKSAVRTKNSRKVPGYIQETVGLEKNWSSMSQVIKVDSKKWILSPNGKTIISQTSGKGLESWDLTTGANRRIVDNSQPLAMICTCFLSPSGNESVTVQNDGSVLSWNSTTGSIQEIISHEDQLKAFRSSIRRQKLLGAGLGNVSDVLAKFSPDGKKVLYEISGMIVLWDITSRSRSILKARSSRKCWRFSPDSKQFASYTYEEHSIKLWDTTTGCLRQTLSSPDMNGVSRVTFSPDGKQLVSEDEEGAELRLWDTTTGSYLKLPNSASHMRVVFSPNGTQMAAISPQDGIIQIWDSIRGTSQMRIYDRPLGTYRIVFSPNGKEIVAISLGGIIRILTTVTGIVQKTLNSNLYGIKYVAFAPGGTHIIFGTKEIIMVWDQTRNEDHDTTYHYSAEVDDILFSSDGKLIASCSQGDIKLWDGLSYQGYIKLWDGTNGDFLNSCPTHQNPLSIKFSQDCRHIMSCDMRSVQLWDAMTSNFLAEILTEGIGNRFKPFLALLGDLSLDKKWIIIHNANDHIPLPLHQPKPDGAGLMNALTGELVRVLPGKLDSTRSVFSPDSRLVSTCSESGSITLWDTQTGKIQKTLKGYTGNLKIVAFSPDSKQLASYSDDQTIKLWDLGESPKASKFLGKHLRAHIGVQPHRELQVSQESTNLEFSPDGQYLITDFERFQLNDIYTQTHAVRYNYLLRLTYENSWICYGGVPFLVLSQGMESISFDSYKDRVVLGLRDGRVLFIKFDRQKLHSMLVGTEDSL